MIDLTKLPPEDAERIAYAEGFTGVGELFARIADLECTLEALTDEQDRPRTWVGLTDAEMKQTCYEVCSYDPYTIARAIEAKLKELNT